MKEEFPEEGELVIATIEKITSHGARVTLDEYGKLSGFLPLGEISSAWVKNVEKYVKPSRKAILKVIRVDVKRREVDLSLRRVTEDARRKKLISYKRERKAEALFKSALSSSGIPESESQKYHLLMENRFGDLYAALEEAVRNRSSLDKLGLPKALVDALVESAQGKIVPTAVHVEGELTLSFPASDGILRVKRILSEALKVRDENTKVEITYLSAPRYALKVSSSDYKLAERKLREILELIGREARKSCGSFSFTRTER